VDKFEKVVLYLELLVRYPLYFDPY